MSDADIENKFAEITRKVLTPTQTRRALDLMWHIEDVKDVGDLLDVIVV